MEKLETKNQTVNVTELYKIAPGLNIEGGLPQHNLINNNLIQSKDVIWANVVIVLDCPLVGEHNITFDELVATNPYPLLENAIEEINEHKFLATYLMILGYYLENGRKLMCVSKDDILNITVHIHQDDKTCKPLRNIIINQLNELVKHFNIDVTHTEIVFRADTPTYVTTDQNCDNIHILISLSQCAGFDEKYPAGTMIIPTEFIPYDIKKKEINIKNKYQADNSLLKDLDDMLNSKFHKYAIEYINKNYQSNNPKKNKIHNVSKLSTKDFHHLPLLHVDQLWNPADRTEEITIIN